MWPLPSVSSRTVIAAAILSLAFAAGWSVNGWRKDTEIARGKSALLAIRAEYAAALSDSQAAAQRLRDQDGAKAQEAEREYQATIDRIRRERSGPGPVVRVQCPPAPAVPTTGDRAASDPGRPAGAATDRSGVAGDGATGYRDLDAAGIRAMTTEAMLVSERLRALQERCSG